MFPMSLRAYLSILYILATPISVSTNDELDKTTKDQNYGVLLDAGSTSTKLKIYRWSPRVSPSLVPRIDLISHDRFKPGLSTYAEDQEGLNNYIQDILMKAKQDTPTDRHGDTPIFLMATAGLRFLSAVEAGSFLEKCRLVLANTTVNSFRYSPSGVTILSGEEEGVYSWIAANYLLGFFDTYRLENESVGILEMGGGSTQIAFIPNGPLFSEEYQVIVANRPYQLYVQSYLQYGANAIKVKVAHEISARLPEQKEIDDPCMLKGDSSKIKMEDGGVLYQRGTGSPRLCLQILQDILRPNTGIHCQPKPCAIGSIYQPSVENITFYAIQAFTYAPESLKVVDKDRLLHIDRLEEAAVRHCSKNISQIVNDSSENYASDDCLMGLYIPTLLTTAYGFSRNTTNIRLTSRIGEGRVDWALGAMLVELSNSFASTNSHFTVTSRTTSPEATAIIVPGYVKGSNRSAPVHSSMPGRVMYALLSIFCLLCTRI